MSKRATPKDWNEIASKYGKTISIDDDDSI
jgi:hypothetical protein